MAGAQEIMRKHGVRHVPVEENGSLVGVATHFDIARQVNSALDEKSQEEIRVRDVYAPDPYVVDLDESLEHVLLQLVDRHVDSALVVRKGKLVGIFTAVDACRVLADVVRLRFAPSGGHDAA